MYSTLDTIEKGDIILFLYCNLKGYESLTSAVREVYDMTSAQTGNVPKSDTVKERVPYKLWPIG